MPDFSRLRLSRAGPESLEAREAAQRAAEAVNPGTPEQQAYWREVAVIRTALSQRRVSASHQQASPR